MRMDEFLRFKGMVESLANSTYCKITAEEFSVELFGRCSPYISHQNVSFGPGHGVQGTICFSNTYGWMAILPTVITPQVQNLDGGLKEFKGESKFVLDLCQVEVPFSMIAPLNNDEVNLNLPQEGMVKVVFTQRRVDYFEEDGTPVFLMKDDPAYTYWEVSGYRARYLPSLEEGIQYLYKDEWRQVEEFSFTEETRLLEIEVGLEKPISIQLCLGGLEAIQDLLYDKEGLGVMGGLWYDPEMAPWVEEAQFEKFKLRLTKAGNVLVWQEGQTIEPTWRQVEKVGDLDGRKGIFAYLNCFFPIGEDHLKVLSWIMERSGDLCHV